MLIEKLKNIDIDYDLFVSIIEAITKSIEDERAVKQYCSRVKNKSLMYFNEHVFVLEYLKIIDRNSNKYKLTDLGVDFLKEKEFFIKLFLKTIKNDGSLEVFCDFDSIQELNGVLYVSNSEIALAYSGLRNFFIINKVFTIVSGNDNIYSINSEFGHFFRDERGMSLNQLNIVLQKQKEQGELAEQFVLKYEQDRVKSKSKVSIVSKTDVSLGYDIISVRNESDDSPIFIEVKSYSNNRIFVTRNEMNISKKCQDNYFMYIVDMKCLELENYSPQIVENPYKNLIINDLIEKQTEIISIKLERNED